MRPPRRSLKCGDASSPKGASAVHLLAGRWTLAVLAELSSEGRRYQDIYDDVGDISYKVLTETLRRAERDGLISRNLDKNRVATATLYELTTLGRSLDTLLAALAEWESRNWSAVEIARDHWDQLSRTSKRPPG